MLSQRSEMRSSFSSTERLGKVARTDAHRGVLSSVDDYITSLLHSFDNFGYSRR